MDKDRKSQVEGPVYDPDEDPDADPESLSWHDIAKQPNQAEGADDPEEYGVTGGHEI